MQKFHSLIQDIASGKADSSALSHSWEYVTADDGESELVWRTLKGDLEATGLSADLIEKHRSSITLRLKDILESGELSSSKGAGHHSPKAIDSVAKAPSINLLTPIAGPSGTDEISGLSEAHVEPSRIKAEGNTLLHLAASAGNVPLVKVLLERGSDVMATNARGWTVLACAQENGHHAVMRAVLEHCSDDKLVLAKIDDHCNSILHYAARTGDADAVLIFLKEGADPNCRNRYNQTPLHLAAWRRDGVVTRHLLDADADMDVEDFWGTTAFELAIQSPHNQGDKAALIRRFLESKELQGHHISPVDIDDAVEFLSMQSIYDESSSENVFKESAQEGGTAEMLRRQSLMNDLAEDLWDMTYGLIRSERLMLE